jgi:hypothetical protein
MSASANSSAYYYGGYCQEVSDGIHELGTEDGKLVPICTPFDADSGSETHVPMPDVASGFSTIVHWICSPVDLNMIAARALTIQTWLNPINAQFRSLNKIAEHCSVTRAALSKAILVFRDEHNIGLTIGRLESSRAVFRQAQRIAFQNGTHSSQTRKNRKPQFNEGDDMNSSARSRFRTLDQAIQAIEKLETQLAAKPVVTTAASPKIAVSPQKPPASPHVSLPSPPRLEDLSMPELKTALDMANSDKNTAMVRVLYSEIDRRRQPL